MTSAPPDSLARLNLDATGKILVPTNPETARIRLAEFEASPGYLDAILNPMHPLHADRTTERQALMFYASQAKRP
jgi:hypothetical protein